MAWSGYFMFGGTEVINATRTEAYATHYNVQWFRPIYNESYLSWLLGEPRYTTPLQDDAPWTDPDNLDSYDFYGVYPLEVTGIEDSTNDAQVAESVIDGGYIGRVRKKTRTVVFSAVLTGASECAVEYGMRWLRSVLTGGACFNQSYGQCGGAELCYLACPPIITDEDGMGPLECYAKVGRTLHDVTTTVGPVVVSKLEMNDGGAAWQVSWTMVAANPAEFGVEKPLIRGFLDPDVDIPYFGGILPPGGNFDENGNVQSDSPCAVPVFRPVYDPLCGLLAAPPEVPSVVPMCFTFPINFLRTSFVIPREEIPLWTTVTPIVSVSTKTAEARSVRVRFYADMFDTGDPSQDPCNFCGDVVFSYIPPSSTIVLDCADRAVYIDQPGIGRRRADALVTNSKGEPFEWPEFSCGYGYVVTVDMPQQMAQRPILDLSLVPRMV
jgi:hypothetical protein